jgi:hypothetical protein
MDRQITAMTSRKTRMKLIESLGRDLSALDAEHLRRHRRIADSACSTRMSVDGRRIVGFASNDYLGLAAHPALIQALGDGARHHGGAGNHPPSDRKNGLGFDTDKSGLTEQPQPSKLRR